MEVVWQINTPTSPMLTDIELLLIHNLLFQAWEIQFWNANSAIYQLGTIINLLNQQRAAVLEVKKLTPETGIVVCFFPQTCSHRVSQESATDQQHLPMVLALLRWGVPAEELSTSQGATTQLQAHPWHTTHGSNT